MIVKLSKHGSSHAIVIPKAILELFKINQDTEFELGVENNNLIIQAIIPRENLASDLADEVIEERKEVLKRLAQK